ncbi:MAG: histidinol dehydrogenase [Burkholderiales bacterium]
MKLIQTQGRGARHAEAILAALEKRGGAAFERVLPVVHRIVANVRRSGDRALLRYAARFDGLGSAASIRIAPEEMRAAWEGIDASLRQALKTAAKQIRTFAKMQLPKSWSRSSTPGLTVGQLVRPIGAVGCYVPSGRHPLPSTLLMTAIPAQVAGVPRIVVVSPKPAPETLAAAHLLGIKELYRVGGAHAIAALAYGTATIVRVDKIVGPGSLYVTAAKRLVAFDCAIDMLAGPTEIIVTSERGDSAEIAADLVAQAEHDPEALAIFITTLADLAKQVIAEANAQSRKNSVARTALDRNGIAIVAGTLEEARALTNRLAPEHLTVDSIEDLEWVSSAGSVFVGGWSAQPMGDYISGPNHTLPTGGMARVRGGLSVNDFVKLVTVQEYDAVAMLQHGPSAVLLAEAEGLTAHAESIRMRLGKASSKQNKSRSSARSARG